MFFFCSVGGKGEEEEARTTSSQNDIKLVWNIHKMNFKLVRTLGENKIDTLKFPTHHREEWRTYNHLQKLN